MELRREVLTSEILHPMHSFELVRGRVEVRWDPLLGHAARLLEPGARLLPPSDFDLAALAEETRASCFFCGERVEQVTPRMPAALYADGRIRRGTALLFPNLLTYSQYSSVTIYGPDLHYLPLERMTAGIVGDALATQVEYARAVAAYDGAARWASVNANHMLPAGSSLFHPHIQSSIDPLPTTVQAALAEVPWVVFEDYLATERRLGERWIGSTGRVHWLAAFAPGGFNEIRALAPGVMSPADLGEDGAAELGDGIARVLNLYAELGYQSFNLAIYGAPPGTDGYALTARLVSRTNLQPLYRSDVTYFEKLHGQAMVDTVPEELAERARARF